MLHVNGQKIKICIAKAPYFAILYSAIKNCQRNFPFANRAIGFLNYFAQGEKKNLSVTVTLGRKSNSSLEK